MKRMTCLVVGLLLGCGAVVQGTNRYVSLTGNSTTPYTNWADAATNIQHAVDVSGTSDIIYITNGTYTLTNYVDTGTKAITLEGFNGSSNTFINGNYPLTTNRCFYLNHASAIISGLTISNGYAATNSALGYEPYGNGGGVYLNAGLIRSCVISNNSSEWKGGGVYLGGSSAIISNSTITRNYSGPTAYAYGGGGVFGAGASKVQNCTLSFNFATNSTGGVLMSENGVVENCVISNNSSGNNGGGFGAFNGGTIRNCVIVQNISGTLAGSSGGGGMRVDGSFTVENCLIMNNTSRNEGGGIWARGNVGMSTIIRNCTVVSNSALSVGGLFNYAAYAGEWTYVFNTIVYSNISSTHAAEIYDNYGNNWAGHDFYTNSCTTPLHPGDGNITNYPQFADWANKNYRLTANSPCLNTGMNQTWMTGAVDLDGHRRIDRLNGRVDIGAYEFINKITMFSGH